jgi:hypothetical protein
MTADTIVKFVESDQRKNNLVNIHFKQRSTVTGIFIQSRDYEELKSKNFWRIVIQANFEQWKQTKNENLARIFSGSEFTRLSEDKS